MSSGFVAVEFEVVDDDLNLAGRVENLLANLLFGLLDGSLDCLLKGESETKRSI